MQVLLNAPVSKHSRSHFWMQLICPPSRKLGSQREARGQFGVTTGTYDAVAQDGTFYKVFPNPHFDYGTQQLVDAA